MDLYRSIGKILAAARDAGAAPADIAEMRRHFKMTTDWNPTKKQLSPAVRKRRRKAQKESRRRNRGVRALGGCRKGQKSRMNNPR